MTAAAAALTVEDVWRSFGGVKAVNGCSFTVADKSITGLVGPNGAGKSTMINLISGLLKPERGSIHLGSKDITGLPMNKISNAGLIRTFQVAREWPKLTVLENVLAAAPACARASGAPCSGAGRCSGRTSPWRSVPGGSSTGYDCRRW